MNWTEGALSVTPGQNQVLGFQYEITYKPARQILSHTKAKK